MCMPHINDEHTDTDQITATEFSEFQLYKCRACAVVVNNTMHMESSRKTVYTFSFQRRTCLWLLFSQHTTGERYNGLTVEVVKSLFNITDKTNSWSGKCDLGRMVG